MRSAYSQMVLRRQRRRRVSWLKSILCLTVAFLASLLGWKHRHIGRKFDAASQIETCGQYQPVEILYQDPELPNGCEVTSLAMIFRSAGCSADKLALYQSYLPKMDFLQIGGQLYGPNPEEMYAGNAADPQGGWYCFELPILQAANSWLTDQESRLTAQSVTGLEQAEIDRYAQEEVPLMVWVTRDYDMPVYSEFTWKLADGMEYRPYNNLHCVALAGMQGDQYRIADPINGFVMVDKELFWNSFSAMGCRAVMVK